jgi:ADP-heptose:LPS heptosyltransferase
MTIEVSRVNIHRHKVVGETHPRDEIKTICAVKVDHIGDFITAMPAFQALRNEFPSAAIDLLCAPWNVAMAQATALFREVHSIQCLPENPSQPAGPLQKTLPLELAGRPYDLAIDLRVQEESREVLANINARWHAGVGSAGTGLSNNIILPRGADDTTDLAVRDQLFLSVGHATLGQPGSFIDQGTAIRFMTYEKHRNLIILGPLTLKAGTYCASFLCSFFPKLVSRRPIAVVGAFVDGTLAVERRSQVTRNHHRCTISFSIPRDGAVVELRLRMRRGRLENIDFHGVLINRTADRQAPAGFGSARLRLHMAEQLLLLVNLVAGRLKGVPFPDHWPAAGADDRRLSVAVSPFSNSPIRDWPSEHYARLITEIHAFYGGEFVLLGSAPQAAALEQLKTRLQAVGVHQIVVEAGKPMPDVIARLSRTSLVLSNNSGIGHVAGALGRPVVAIYSAAHDVNEWGSVGSNVWLLQAEIGCKLCRLDFNEICPNDRRCMRDLPPEEVFAVIRKSVVWEGNRERALTVI